MKLKRVLKGYVEFWLFAYYIEFNASARWPMSHFKIHRRNRWQGYSGFNMHIVWGKFSLNITQPQIETVRMCSECDGTEPIGGVSHGDESWDVCPNCRTIEGKTHYISLWDYENEIYHNHIEG